MLDGIRSMFRNDLGQKSAVNVNDLIGEVLAVVRGELDDHQVLLQSELSNGLPTVLAAQTQLQQVLLNLVMNAIDAMSSVTNRERILIVKSEIGESGQRTDHGGRSGTGIDPKIGTVFLKRSLQRRLKAWGWDWRFAAQSSNLMGVFFRSRRAHRMDQVFVSCFQRLRRRRLSALSNYGKRRRTSNTSRADATSTNGAWDPED